MKRIRIYIGLLLCMTMLVGVPEPLQAKNNNVTSATIKDMENQISKAEKEMKDLKSSLSDVKGLVKKLEGEKSNLKNYVEKLDATLEVVEAKIIDLEGQITEKEADIAFTQKELEEAKTVEANQYEAMRKRIKSSYESNEYQVLEQIFAARSFHDLLNRITYEEEVVKYERQKLDEFISNKEYIALCEKQLQVEKEYLDAVKVSVQNEQAAVEALISTKKQEIEKYESNISTQEKAIKEYEADIAEQNEIIKQLEKAVEEEKERIRKQNGLVLTYDGGTFAFPLESYTRVSDDYGPRIHPTLNVPQFHNGVDFASPKGTPIYAAYNGVVVAATYSSTMGNYVMIDHGDGLYTIYMHASKLYVKKDEVVKKGQKIAGVGTTGRSTGNHLHFSVRKNGEYVSPWNYIVK
ncbi:MAG: peptidoglycan DD-metalloendopeptidase family protein [Lachnospiraceae bacterium]|nr:peptidoglycan DD-metalloendopeptidase family protein [Lachnospiraceae bacterium]